MSRSLLALTAAAALAILLVGTAAQARRATTVDSFRQVSYAGDTWSNFDLVARTGPDVDWPVDVIFWGNATVSKVFSRLGWIWPGSNVYMQVGDGAGTAWVANAGRKNGLCTDTHLRLYADADGSLSNPGLGSYVVGTAHLDKNECGRTPAYGWNETAEANVAARAAAVWGASAVQRNADALPDGTSTAALLGNAISLVVGNHTWENDGRPTLIRVP
jgi:hypothetical protein